MKVQLYLNNTNEKYVVMKENAERAYANGIVFPTTKYEYRYAKMENVNGAMHIPLRYIAKVNGFTVDCDIKAPNTKVTNATGEYLIISVGNNVITKYSADGILLSTTQAPLPLSFQNGITIALCASPMRLLA